MSDLINRIYGDFDKKNEIPKVKIPKFATGGICNDAIFPKLDAFSQIDEIVKDITKKKDNAMAIEFTKCIGELLRKNGVVPKMTESTRNFETDKTFETRYGVSIDELDFSEHDKVFEDKIADLEQRIRELIKEKNEYKRKCNDFGFENQDLKKITKGYEDKIAELEKEVVNRKQAFEDKCKDYKSTSELLGKYQQENESLKKRVVELENFSCQVEQETESLVEKLKQRIAELESKETEICEKEPNTTDSAPSVEWYDNRHQSDCIEINRLNTTIDVLIHKVEYLRQFAGLE